MSLTKEVYRLMRNVNKLTDGQVIVESFDSENTKCQVVKVVVEPNDGLYKGGRFRFSISIPESYPHGDIPAVWCDSKVYHPNIDVSESKYDDFDANVCLNLLQDEIWDNSFGLGGIVLGLLFLMHNPDFDDMLPPLFFHTSIEIHTENVKRFMNGEDFDGGGFELEKVEKGVESRVDAVNEVSDMTETTTGVSKGKNEDVSESKEGGINSSNDLECAVDAAPTTEYQKTLTSAETEEIKHKVISLDDEFVFIYESPNVTDEVTVNEEEAIQDISTLKGPASNKDDELNTEHTQTVKSDAANEHAQTGSIDEIKIISNNTIEDEIDSTTNDTVRDNANNSENTRMVFGVDSNPNLPNLQDCFISFNVLVHRQYRRVRRTARIFFSYLPDISRTLRNLLYKRNRY